MRRRQFALGLGVGVAVLAGGCQYWNMFKEEMARTDEMFIESFRRRSFLTWNINASLGLDGKRDLNRTIEALKSVSANVIALQEIDRKTARSDGEDQFERLEQALALKGHWCRTAQRNEGETGMALFVGKACKVKAQVVDLPGDGALLGMKFPDYAVGTVGFPAKEEERLAAAEKLAELIEAERPFFLLGDWDENPDSPFIQKVRRSFAVVTGFAHTYPADEPASCFDYIAVSRRHRARFEHINCKVLPVTTASDHRPVTATVW